MVLIHTTVSTIRYQDLGGNKMCSRPKVTTVAAPAPTPPTPTIQDYTDTEEVTSAKKNDKRKAAQAAGYQSTIATSGTGLSTAAPTQQNTLLGN
jgi:hypothetical protein